MPVFIFLLLLLIPVGAARAEVLRLTLKDSIVMALENNNRVRAATFNASAAQQGIAIATSGYYPRLFLEESFTASNAPTQTFMMKLDEGRFRQDDFQINRLNNPSAQQDFKSAVTAQIPLYIPSISPTRTMAIKEADIAGIDLDAARQEVAFEVFRLYLEVQKAEAQLTVSEKALSEARESMRLARVRSEAGTGLKSDELRARTQLSLVEQQQITAHNDLVIAQMQLAVQLGCAPGSRVEPADKAPVFAVKATRESLTGTALETRNDLRRFRSEVEKADAGVGLARSAYLPSLEGFASYQLNSRDVPFGNDNDSWLAGVNLKWQVFDGFRRGHERKRAAAQRSAAAERLDSGTKQVAFQVQESLLRREEMGKRLEVARHAVLDAEETVRLLSRRFENSLATMLELLDAQTTLNQARASLAATEAGYSLAGGQVYHMSGVFLEEMLK